MKRQFIVLLIALIINVAAATTVWGSDTSDGIAASNQQFAAAFDSADAAALTALYSNDATLLPPNSENVSGAENIQALWQGFFDSGASKVDLGTSELYEFGDSAVEVGTFAVSDAEGNAIDNGKYMVLWKNDGGQWKLYRDMWSSSNAPAAPEDTASE